MQNGQMEVVCCCLLYRGISKRSKIKDFMGAKLLPILYPIPELLLSWFRRTTLIYPSTSLSMGWILLFGNGEADRKAQPSTCCTLCTHAIIHSGEPKPTKMAPSTHNSRLQACSVAARSAAISHMA